MFIMFFYCNKIIPHAIIRITLFPNILIGNFPFLYNDQVLEKWASNKT